MQVSLLEIKSAISSDMLLGYSDKPTYVALLQRPAHAEPWAADYAALREMLLR